MTGMVSRALASSVVVRNELRDDSDIDLAIEMDSSRKSLRNFLAFKRQLESNFNRPVDLGIESALKPALKELVAQDIKDYRNLLVHEYFWRRSGNCLAGRAK